MVLNVYMNNKTPQFFISFFVFDTTLHGNGIAVVVQGTLLVENSK